MRQAKGVLQPVVQNNQDKVSFQFGTYTQFAEHVQQPGAGTTGTRFQYWTTDQLSPSMAGERAHGAGRLPGHRSAAASSRGRSSSRSGARSTSRRTPTAPAPSTRRSARPPLTGLPKFYARGGSGAIPATSTTPQNLAFDLQTAMNAATCATGTPHEPVRRGVQHGQWRVHVHTPRRRAAVARSCGARRPTTSATRLAETNAATTAWQNPGSVPTDAPWQLLYRGDRHGLGPRGLRVDRARWARRPSPTTSSARDACGTAR